MKKDIYWWDTEDINLVTALIDINIIYRNEFNKLLLIHKLDDPIELFLERTNETRHVFSGHVMSSTKSTEHLDMLVSVHRLEIPVAVASGRIFLTFLNLKPDDFLKVRIKYKTLLWYIKDIMF